MKFDILLLCNMYVTNNFDSAQNAFAVGTKCLPYTQANTHYIQLSVQAIKLK